MYSSSVESIETLYLSACFALYLFVCFALIVLCIVGNWKCYEKAGEHGWAAIVPFYNSYLSFKIAMGQGWMFLLLLIPVIGSIFAIVCNYKFAKAYGKSDWFAIGNIFFPYIFTTIIGFDDSEFVGNK